MHDKIIMPYDFIIREVPTLIRVDTYRINAPNRCTAREYVFGTKTGKAKFKLGRYESGQKRCQVCQIFIKWDGGIWCPCCSHKLRSNPRNIKFRHKQLLAKRRLAEDSVQKSLNHK